MEKRNPGGITFHDAGRSEATGFAALRTEIRQDGYRRLAWMGGLAAAVAIVRLITTLAIEGPAALMSAPLVAFGVVLIASLIVIWVCKTVELPVEWFPPFAIGFEVIVAGGFSTIILNWQNLLGDAGWPFGAVPGVAIFMILFANVVPLSPATHLLGAVVSALALPVWFFVSLSLYDVPASIGPEQNLRVFRQLMVPMGIAVAVAYFTARRLYVLSRDLSDAKRMGSYRLTEKLGAGGMGEVWKAQHHLLARPAAVKLIRTDVIGGGVQPVETLLQRFEQEVQATANLRSLHTIEIYDYGTTEDGTFYYVMELLDGLDLEALVGHDGPATPARVIHILRQVCHSLGEAHEAGLVHRDIKPANIYLCRYGRDVDVVKVLDFGMVKQTVTAADETAPQLTQMGTFAGTPAYAAPEMAQGLVDQIDARTDIYAVGCVAFWLLTGRQVFEGNPMQVLMRHINERPEAPSVHAPFPVPPELDRLVLECLEKRPDQRVGSVDDLADRLARVPITEPWSPVQARQWWDTNRPATTPSRTL